MDFSFLTSKEAIAFVQKNLSADVPALMLKKSPFPSEKMRLLAEQLVARQKIKDKMPSWFANPNLLFLPLASEQSSSEITARFKASLLQNYEVVADLTAGLGVDTHAFSQHNKQVLHIEPNTVLQQIIKHNFEQLGIKNITFFNQTAEVFLQQYAQPLKAVFIDPSRRDNLQNKVYQLADCQPNVQELLPQLLAKNIYTLIKTSPLLDIKQACEQLLYVEKVWVLAIKNEVKELLLAMNPQHKENNYTLEAINFQNEDTFETFSTTASDEIQAQAQLSLPQKYLLEPNLAILKAGAFKSFAQQFNLAKLHPHTHLYTTESFSVDKNTIPARIFTIKHICKYDKKTLLQLLDSPQANITVRNFPENVAQIRQKLGLKEGGDTYIFATTLLEGQKVLLVCEKSK